MMGKWGVYLAFIGMLVFLSLWLQARKTTKQLREEQAASADYLESSKQLLEQKNTIIFNNFLLSGIEWSSVILRDVEGMAVNPTDLIEMAEPTLIAYFDSGMCSVCLQREWLNFQTLASQSDKILLFASGYPSAYFRQKEEFSSLQERIFIVEEGLPEAMESPVYYVRHSQGFHAFQVEKSTNATFETVAQLVK